MKIFKSKSWQFEVHGQDGYVILFGKNIFDYKWESTGKSVTVKILYIIKTIDQSVHSEY